MKVLEVRDWHTVNFPMRKLGRAEITRETYPKGYYLMEGVGGYDLFHIPSQITVNALRLNGETVMVDDPLHWYGMERLADRAIGRVWVAGLGLGLIIHHLVKNRLVTSITVYEISQDVIDLISPSLPKDKRVGVELSDALYEADWYASCAENGTGNFFDTYIFDLWVKEGDAFNEAMPNLDAVMNKVYKLRIATKAMVFVWGHRDPTLNPAVVEVGEEYRELLRQMHEREAGCQRK
jgi:hypothetical protein